MVGLELAELQLWQCWATEQGGESDALILDVPEIQNQLCGASC